MGDGHYQPVRGFLLIKIIEIYIMEEDKCSIGEILKEKIENQAKSYNDFFTNLFIYGPSILDMTVDEIKKYKEDNKN